MKWRNEQSTFASAIDNGQGQVDAGYLALAALLIMVVAAIPFMGLLVAWAMYLDPEHKVDLQSFGIGVGSVCGGFAAAVAAVGVFRAGDRDKGPPVVQITTLPIKEP
jgi:hypothetical protein